jgi:hypothetical protein
MVNLHRRVETYRARKEANFASGYQCFPSQPHPHSCLLVFKDFTYKAAITDNPGLLSSAFVQSGNGRSSGAELRSSNSIELPFPKQLTDSTGLRINGNERDPFVEGIASKVNDFIDGKGSMTAEQIPEMLQGIGAAGAAFSGGDLMNSAGNMVKQALGTDIKDIASAAQYLLRNSPLLSGNGVGKAIDLVTGQTINPRETLSFEGVNLRNHQFAWELYPNSQADSERIKNIIQTIKRKALPEVTNLMGIPKAFLQYPSIVDIYLLGVRSDHFIKYKSSMITEFTVDYGAGGGVAIMKGGKPAGVTISLNLTELEIETAHDYGTAGGDDIALSEQEQRRQNIISASAG